MVRMMHRIEKMKLIGYSKCVFIRSASSLLFASFTRTDKNLMNSLLVEYTGRSTSLLDTKAFGCKETAGHSLSRQEVWFITIEV